MKRIFKTLLIFTFGIILLVGCSTQKNATSYYIDGNNNLMVVYEDNSETNIGTWGENIIQSLGTISISNDGYYEINGVKTAIKAKVPSTYSINSNGHLVVTYTDKTKEDLGNLSESLVDGVQNISVNKDGNYVINGVTTSIKAYDIYTVSFNTGFSKTVKSQSIRDGYKVEKPAIERTGYSFNGWYCNDEEWKFNSDVVKNNMTLTAEWIANTYTVSFNNPKGSNPNQINATFDNSVTLPSVSDVIGYTFAGWYNGNTKVESGKWEIASDVTLTAKWTTNEYTITLNPGTGSVSNTSVKVKYGEAYILPVPTNSYGAFTGWLYNDNPVTDSTGKSISNWEFTSNVTFTVDWTIKVYTAEDLKKMNTYLNGEFILQNDIDLDGVTWTPVGTYSAPFTGSLNGNNHTISNLTLSIDNTTKIDSFGLFGYIQDTTIKDLTLNQVSIFIDNISKSYFVGGLFGYDSQWYKTTTGGKTGTPRSSITNITTSGLITCVKQSSSYEVNVGGISGRTLNDTFSGCFNNISISGGTYSGGIAGYVNQSTFDTVANEGNISNATYAGGICAYSYSTQIIKASNTGTITAAYSAGGIIGKNTEATVKYSVNRGTISATDMSDITKGAGGIVGSGYDAQTYIGLVVVNCCYNTGNVSGYMCGGITGYQMGAVIENCYNSGNVNGTSYSGGIIATGSFTVKQCYNAGSVNGDGVRSTISYILSNGRITDCYYSCSTSDMYMAQQKTGTYISLTYDKSFYTGSMFWIEYNNTTKKGEWIFHDDSMPTLWWETK